MRFVPQRILSRSWGLVRLFNLQYLRLYPLDGLAHLRTQADLPNRELPEGRQMLLDDAEDRCQHPTLMLCVLAVEVAQLPFERVHQQAASRSCQRSHCSRALPLRQASG